MVEYIPVLMFAVVCLMLMAGYPVAFSLAGTALIFAMVGTATGHFDMSFLHVYIFTFDCPIIKCININIHEDTLCLYLMR